MLFVESIAITALSFNNGFLDQRDLSTEIAISKRCGQGGSLAEKPDLMADIHHLEALNSFTLDCAAHSS
jgi:hypothetical protein